MVRLTQPIGFPSPIKNPTSEVGSRVLRAGALRARLSVRRISGCEFTTPLKEYNTYHFGTVYLPSDAVLSPVQAGAGLAGSSSCQARVIQVHVKHDLKAFKRRLAPISIYPYAPGNQGFRGRFAQASPISI